MKLYSVREVSELLQITERDVHALVRSGKLGCIEITNRRRRFTEEHIGDFLTAANRNPRTPKKVDSVSRGLLQSPSKKQISRGGGPSSEVFDKASLKEEMASWH